jgi:hypothetical protein
LFGWTVDAPTDWIVEPDFGGRHVFKIRENVAFGFCGHGNAMTDYREPLTDEQAEQMERGLKRLLRTPPKPHGKNPTSPPPKHKERPASKGRVHKGKARS